MKLVVKGKEVTPLEPSDELYKQIRGEGDQMLSLPEIEAKAMELGMDEMVAHSLTDVHLITFIAYKLGKLTIE